jgi:hypothetical protein
MEKQSESKIGDPVSDYQKRVDIVRDELKADPARSDKILAGVSDLSKASVYRIRAAMEASGDIPFIPQHMRKGVNDRKIGEKNGNVPDYDSGPRIKVPAGVALVDIIRAGMKIEIEQGRSVNDASAVVGVGRQSYREAKAVVLLSDLDSLTHQEKETVSKAMEIMKRERRTREAYALIKDIAAQVWGKAKSGYTKKTANRVVGSFMGAITIITEACDHGRRLKVPNLSADEAMSITLQIMDAEKALKELRLNLKGRLA